MNTWLYTKNMFKIVETSKQMKKAGSSKGCNIWLKVHYLGVITTLIALRYILK